MEATYDVFVPGRLCILGEHTDWAGGYRSSDSSLSIGRTVVCCTNEGLYASCRRYKPQLCHYSTDRHVESFDEPLTESILSSIAATGEFYSYVAGTLLGILIHETYGPLLRTNGLSISNYRTDLPMKKGLSSSAAICVLVVRCFAAAYQIHISIEEVMSLAYDGEMRTPSRCGRMDQCVALGAGGLALMEFTGDTRRPCHITPLTTPKPLYLVVADLNAGKDTVTILRTLNSCYPKPANDTQRGMLQYTNKNVELVSAACAAISSGDVCQLGVAMNQAQHLFDTFVMPICFDQLSSPRLHEVMQDKSIPAIAVKGVGSQGDGSVQLLCTSHKNQLDAIEVLRSKYGYSSFALTIPAHSTA